MSDMYVLDGKVPVRCDDTTTWGKTYANNTKRRVARDELGDVSVSTMFLGLDHSFGDGPPQLFETMVFGGPLDGEMERCSTWSEAELQHMEMCMRVVKEAAK